MLRAHGGGDTEARIDCSVANIVFLTDARARQSCKCMFVLTSASEIAGSRECGGAYYRRF